MRGIIYVRFKNGGDTVKRPLITMSAVTGKPTKRSAYEYMQALKENGIEQVMLYPRSGCEVEYLSEEWFDTVSYFISAASLLDMCIWLYDDFNWPSGDAGGRVTAVPEYRLCAILTKGEGKGQITVKSSHNSGLFGEKYFPNLLSDKAVDYFIQCTHEEYYRRFGNHFGKIIKGMFTDEPSIGYCCQGDCLPYYDGLRQDYLEAYGISLDQDINEESPRLYKQAMAVISQRFKSCYLDKINSWCVSHGILSTGHFMCDHNPFYGVTHSGNAPENLSSLSLPGIDEIYTNFEDECEMTLLSVAELARGENGAMAELFALGSCDMSYTTKRAMIYLCACHKIDHYFLAVSHLDMRGNMLVKDYFNNFSPAQPDFSGMQLLSKVAEHAATIAQKDFEPDLYLRFPFEVACDNIGKSIDTMPFISLVNDLAFNQIQFKLTTKDEGDGKTVTFNERLEAFLGGKPFDISKFKKAPYVTDKNGGAPRGIFVRKFRDGTFVVINLFAKEGEYDVFGKSVYLEKHGVWLSSDILPHPTISELSAKFKVGYKNQNVARTMHVNGNKPCHIHCACDTSVIFAVREGVAATINGEKILCQSVAASVLPKGMGEFYKASLPYVLKKGVNTLTADNDFKYMPSVILVGDFSYEITPSDPYELTLLPRKTECEENEYISDYGEIELSTEIQIPENATQIELLGTTLLTKVHLGGKMIGERAFAPYVYEIPKELCGKATSLKIVQYSSIAPIFGNVAYWDKTVTLCGWRGTPSPDQAPFGVSKILFK